MKIAGRMLLGITCVAVALCVACKPSEPPAPATPSSAPLADATPKVDAPSADALPPGHPPLGDMSGQKPEMGKDGLPAGHPPLGDTAGQQTEMGKDGLPTGHPPIKAPGGDEAAVVPVEPATQFVGLSLTPPDGWQAIDPGQGPMSAVAAFVLAPAEGDSDGASVRLTYFPGMRDIPLQQNLERWYGMVKQADGKPTKDVAKLETFDAGGATITLVDMAGSIGGKEGQRMIAAVIEHPQGPHFLKVAGPDATMAKWRDAIVEYLKSAKVAE